MARRTYLVCSWMPHTFLIVAIGGGLVAASAAYDVLAEMLIGLSTTVVGVFLALLAERYVERRRDREAKHDRLSEWIDVITKGAKANSGYVDQMRSLELPRGLVPTYRTDQVLAIALHQGAARDLVGIHGFVDALRAAVFELAHLDNKLDLLMAAPNMQVFKVNVTNTIEIANNAHVALEDLLQRCAEASRALPPRFVDA